MASRGQTIMLNTVNLQGVAPEVQIRRPYPGASLYLDEYDEEWGWVHPTDIVTGYAEVARFGRKEDDSSYELQVAETKAHGTSGLVARNVQTGKVDRDVRRLASLIVGPCGDEKLAAKQLLRAIAVSRHGVLYRTAGHRSGHMRMDRTIAQVQQRYIKLKPGGMTWSAELSSISDLPILTPVISLNKISPWRRLESLSQCEDGTENFQPYAAFLMALYEVNPGAVQLRPTSMSCGWPTWDATIADKSRKTIVADATLTCRTSMILQCHVKHELVEDEKYHVQYAGLWRGERYEFSNMRARIGFKKIAGVEDLNRKTIETENAISIMEVSASWEEVARVNRLAAVNDVYTSLSDMVEDDLRKVRRFYSNLWEPLHGIRLELSDEEVFIDLAVSLSAVMYSTGLKDMGGLLNEFLTLIEQDWVKGAKENKVFPCRMGAPCNPAVLLNKERSTFYTFGASFSWPEKSRVDQQGDKIYIPGALSRVYKDGLVVGDLDGSIWDLNDYERSLLANGEIGWISEFLTDEGSYRVVEIDVISAKQYDPDPTFRKELSKKTRMSEPRISSVRKDDTDWVRKCLPISVILLAAQRKLSESGRSEILRDYDEVKDEISAELSSDKLSGIDLAHFHVAMGSYGSRNKIWSARALAEHKRMWSLLRSPKVPEAVEWRADRVRSRLIYSDKEAVFVRARRPWDTLTVLVGSAGLGAWLLVDATNRGRDFYDLGTMLTAVLGTVTGLTGLYHTIKYRAWSLGDAVRAYRRCKTVEEMRTVMKLEEVHKTLLDAGESGRFTDGARTCAYSDHNDGTFAVAQGLEAKMFQVCGGKLGLDSEGDDVIIYRSRIRKVELLRDGMAHVTQNHGVYPVVRATRLTGTILAGVCDLDPSSNV